MWSRWLRRQTATLKIQVRLLSCAQKWLVAQWFRAVVLHTTGQGFDSLRANYASVAELVYAAVLETVPAMDVGSTPT